MKLYTYWRSSAAYRVRIALAWKGLAYETIARNLVRQEQHSPEYAALNPQGLVPALADGTTFIAQSLAIIEYLDETGPEPPLLPPDPAGRAQVRSMALAIACEIHPLNNTRVRRYLKGPLAQDEATVDAWCRHWIAEGFRALEQLAARCSTSGRHLYGDRVTLADVCLVPQMYNARRLKCDLAAFPRLVAIDAALATLPAFAAARPEVQPDAE